ncbi:MAG: A/G-specific adenine glycosylase [Betaproteobacteria bacterium]
MGRRSTSFADRVIRWQRCHGRRDLPWQGTRDAYRIWVSEIMLQQTQVAAVVPYYEDFLRRFPDVFALAAAPSSDVMAAWAGLGYYSRARNLHRCAQAVVERHEGRFPRAAEALAELPGIGRSTAAAIAVFACGERAAILDGNVKRVLARHFAVEGYPGTAAVEKRLWSIAEQELPATGIEAYTQGLMDLGATLCVRARPRCGDCPVMSTCVAREQGRTDALPAPRPSRARPVRHAIVLIVRDRRGAVLLETRPPTGIWGGLVSLPEFDAEADDDRLRAMVAGRYALQVDLRERLPDLRHEFSHYTLVMHPRVASVRRALGAADPASQWVEPEALRAAALPAPVRRLLLARGGEA